MECLLLLTSVVSPDHASVTPVTLNPVRPPINNSYLYLVPVKAIRIEIDLNILSF